MPQIPNTNKCACGKTIDNRHTMANGAQKCSACYEAGHYQVCNSCMEMSDKPFTEVIIGRNAVAMMCPLCVRNFGMCADCGKRTQATITVSNEDRRTKNVCPSCCPNYTPCHGTRCNGSLHPNGSIIRMRNGRTYCQHCVPAQQDTDRLMDYQYDVLQTFPEVKKQLEAMPHKIYYGIEIEAESTSDGNFKTTLRDVYGLTKHCCIIKSDGSLAAGCGMEIVSYPMEWKLLRRAVVNFIRKKPKTLVSWNTQGRCGVHIHISKLPFPEAAMILADLFINRTTNRDYIEFIANRRSNGYTKFVEKSPQTAGRAGSKYEPLNLGKAATMELRIFRGSLNEDTVLSYLEFALAFALYFKNTAKTVQDTYLPPFFRFVSARRKMVPHLYKKTLEYIAKKKQNVYCNLQTEEEEIN